MSVAGQPPRLGRNALAYVFQSPRLVPWRNARDNVCLSIQLRTPSVGKAERQERSAKLLRMVGLANDVGLLAEEYDPAGGRMLGNFPQAFSHVALVNTAMNLYEREKPAEQRAEKKAA